MTHDGSRMTDCNGATVKIGDRVVVLRGECIPPGSQGVVVRIRKKVRAWSRSRKYPTHADIRERADGEAQWMGWFDPDGFALLAHPAPRSSQGETA